MTLYALPIEIASETQALELIEQVTARSEAEGVFVSLESSDEALSRFCGNQMTQNVNQERCSISITSYFGARSATTTATAGDPEAIEAALRSCEALARVAPEDPEWVPLLELQTYDDRQAAFDEETAACSPLQRGRIVQRVCRATAAAGIEGAGTLATASRLRAVGNSRGLRAAGRSTAASFGFTARTGGASSWGERTAWNLGALNCDELAEELIERAHRARSPRAIAPGLYPVILHPAAFAELLAWVGWNLDARAADEGRSFMSRPDGGTRLGEAMFSPLVHLERNPAHPLLQSAPFLPDGQPNRPLTLIREGVPELLHHSRYWAARKGCAPTGAFFPLTMAGSGASPMDLVSRTERGVLVHRAWYVRAISPRELTVTGMTRDGTFWIEDGQIAYPIRNLRFNQSLPHLLRDIDAVGAAQRYGPMVVPAVRSGAFRFTSVTDSV
ncbi:TldD/PmbA family protein [Gloeobacter violaceus]|uniref:Gll3062 protein n=1 Tax=Gloeobacter violaceus (strain ATCC 29082 / PCC 7421) TaxID=251221 RepID=Q7NCB7_GLOVI|nr:metallopeptidase TldD-related protein [Gloeobacter violaceus]BAC91003.1 gll3062 [Gloeobacter violaceus PCC 7421]